MKNTFLNFCKNYLSSMSVILIVYWFYTHHTYFSQNLNASYHFYIPVWFLNISFSTFDVYFIVIILYAVLLAVFYIYYPNIQSKSSTLFRCILRKKGPLTSTEKTACLAILVKIFFVPLLINWFLGHTENVLQGGYNLVTNISLSSIDFLGFFNTYLFTTLLQCIFLIDVAFFACGYLTEIPGLKNKIISVEPTLFGWVICLMCYPPFNNVTNTLVGWSSRDFPQFSSSIIHITLNSLILVLMAVYTLASVSLGWKASNLTNRGIVTTGVYRFIRHPAYTAKNLAWWIGSIPVIIVSFSQGWTVFFLAVLSPVVWSLIYYFRAVTEEQHLLRGENGYREYMQKVKYRMIPGII